MILKDKMAALFSLTSFKEKEIHTLNQKEMTDNLIIYINQFFLCYYFMYTIIVIFFISGGGLHLLAEPKSTWYVLYE